MERKNISKNIYLVSRYKGKHLVTKQSTNYAIDYYMHAAFSNIYTCVKIERYESYINNKT